MSCPDKNECGPKCGPQQGRGNQGCCSSGCFPVFLIALGILLFFCLVAGSPTLL